MVTADSIIPETPTTPGTMAAHTNPALVPANVSMADVTPRGIGVLPAPGPPSVNAFNEILSVDCVVGSGRGSVAEAISLAHATELADGPFTAVNGFGGKGAKGGGARNGISLLPLYGDETTTHLAAAAVKAAILAGVPLGSLFLHACAR